MDKKTALLVGLACVPMAATVYFSTENGETIVCPFRAATGLPCPFCGTTRAALYLLQGDPAGFNYNYFWIFALPAVALLLASSKVRGLLNEKRSIIAGCLLLGAGWAVAFSNFTAITS